MQHRSWTQPHGPSSPEPDAFLHLRLRLDDAWFSDGEWRALRDVATVGLWSILGYLRWHAPALQARDPEASVGVPDAYLAGCPLVAAIDAELARRTAVQPGTALATLRVLGLAPWELPASFATPRRRRSAG